MARKDHVYNLCIVGLGNVGQELVRLLQSRSAELGKRYGIAWRITGIGSRRLGWIAARKGLDCADILDAKRRARLKPSAKNVRDWLKQAEADVLFEASSLSRHDGQPAIEYITAALRHGAHAISANKGPVVYAYRELSTLAKKRGRRFLFESTVMDGAPIFSLLRETLPMAAVRGFRGILNSTTNVVLGQMESGVPLADAVKKAQAMGLAETDPSDDLEGWDATMKVCALATVLLGEPLHPENVERRGITGLHEATVKAAREEGRPFKLICRAQREAGGLRASVKPEQLPLSDPLSQVDGSSSAVCFELDILPGLTLIEHNPSLTTTAYGMVADFIRAVTG